MDNQVLMPFVRQCCQIGNMLGADERRIVFEQRENLLRQLEVGQATTDSSHAPANAAGKRHLILHGLSVKELLVAQGPFEVG